MSQSLLYDAFGVREGYDYVERLFQDGCVLFVLSVPPIGSSAFAPGYAHYTHRLEAFVNDMRGLMTLSDLATITGLCWDTSEWKGTER